MNYLIDIQHASHEEPPVSDEILIKWVELVLNKHCPEDAELTIRIVNEEEITGLNHSYRNINKSTNVLAFPAEHLKHVLFDYYLLGDMVICPDVLKRESGELHIPLEAHWAHIVIHATLHLLGYDHIKDEETHIMQGIEVELLAQLGFDDPYRTEGD